MKISYYPGCTLKNHARNFEDSTLSSMTILGVEVEELTRWNCCGTVFSLATDDLMHHLAPVRNLIRAKEAGAEELATGCAMCYNTLKRSNERVRSDPESLDVINGFMNLEEVDYQGDVEVRHLLEFLRDRVGFDELEEKVERPLGGLRVASYYGCLLVRPREVAFDDVENPAIMEDLVVALGAEPVPFFLKTECCGAYLTVDKPEIVAERTYKILGNARNQGAEIVAVSCPLCAFNLDRRQAETLRLYPDFEGLPVVYFTQLMALALGCPETALRLDLHHIDPKPVLAQKGLV
ncbi:MAG: CoB--CoM heterodisulfide reductase iron-sulfur subunit B family protein [Alphaproteobacteria bacterium]|jgi:heterodisulfide reductase subunit B|nr:CoB--CoM heterodisulfide reductase iron-sulfur subunit B family protein [Alphaproteobacteria bacterium]